MTEQREDFSHAEFARFVQEAQEQRERADRAEVALAEMRASLQSEWESNHGSHCGSPSPEHANGTACSWEKPTILDSPAETRGAAIIAAGQAMARVLERHELPLPDDRFPTREECQAALDAWQALGIACSGRERNR